MAASAAVAKGPRLTLSSFLAALSLSWSACQRPPGTKPICWNLNMRVYIYIYTIYVYADIHAYIHTPTHTHIYIHIIYIYIHIHYMFLNRLVNSFQLVSWHGQKIWNHLKSYSSLGWRTWSRTPFGRCSQGVRLPSYLGIFRSLFLLCLVLRVSHHITISQSLLIDWIWSSDHSDPGVLWRGLDPAVSTTRGRIALAEACGPQCGAGWISS